MSSYPSAPNPGYSGYQPPPSNSLGISGFVVSLAGVVVTFGFLCPIGLILSLIALRKEPRGFAVAGTIIGLLGSALAGTIVMMAVGWINSGLTGSGSLYICSDQPLVVTSRTYNQISINDPCSLIWLRGWTAL